MATQPMHPRLTENSGSSVQSLINDKDIEFKQWVTFYINNELFALDALQVVEVQKYGQTTPVPGSNACISGLINLRGKVITVIDTRILFVLPYRAPDHKTNIILVDFNQDEMLGFIVDSVADVVNIPTKSIEIAPKISDRDTKNVFVKGLAFNKKSLIIFLDIEKINSHLTPIKNNVVN